MDHEGDRSTRSDGADLRHELRQKRRGAVGVLAFFGFGSLIIAVFVQGSRGTVLALWGIVAVACALLLDRGSAVGYWGGIGVALAGAWLSGLPRGTVNFSDVLILLVLLLSGAGRQFLPVRG